MFFNLTIIIVVNNHLCKNNQCSLLVKNLPTKFAKKKIELVFAYPGISKRVAKLFLPFK